MSFDAARDVLINGIAARAFPGAVAEVGTSDVVLWHEAFGRLTYDQSAPQTDLDTIYDLASLTKVIATTTLLMGLVDQGHMRLSDGLGRWIDSWRGEDRTSVTVELALAHGTGLPAWLPLYREHRGPRDYATVISRTPLEYAPGSKSIYSDLGFILLGLVVEQAGDAPLDRQFAVLASRLGLGDIAFLPPGSWRSRVAPTEYDSWRRRLLVGDVHDENAAALGGVAGHAGLFGSVSAVGRFARHLLRARRGTPGRGWTISQRTAVVFTTHRPVEGSSRALGWDTRLPTSSCGAEVSPSAFGHTGFTGTSLWLDPALDVYVVLLTNRVHPSRDNLRIGPLRPAFHDAVVRALRAGR